VVRNGPNIYLNVDTDPPIYRPGRSITVAVDKDYLTQNTVDIDGRLGFTYKELLSMVD